MYFEKCWKVKTGRSPSFSAVRRGVLNPLFPGAVTVELDFGNCGLRRFGYPSGKGTRMLLSTSAPITDILVYV